MLFQSACNSGLATCLRSRIIYEKKHTFPEADNPVSHTVTPFCFKRVTRSSASTEPKQGQIRLWVHEQIMGLIPAWKVMLVDMKVRDQEDRNSTRQKK